MGKDMKQRTFGCEDSLGWGFQHQTENAVLRVQISKECLVSDHRKLVLEEYLFLKKMVSEGLVSRPFLILDVGKSR
jgi:hypothetical protein